MASRSWNRVELIGNLTRDPELRYTPNGAAVCTFGLATNRTYVSEGEKKEEVDFHRLVAWNKLAELCNQLLKKGHRVFVSGRLQTRTWEAQDGQQRTITEVVIEDMILLTPRSNGEPMVTEERVEVAKAEEPEEKPAEKEKPKEEIQEEASVEEISQESEDEPKPGKEDKPSKSPPKEEVEDDLPF